MGRKAKRISHLLSESQRQPEMIPNQCLTLSNMISPHFTIRVTEFTQNGFENTLYSNGNSISTNVLGSVKRIAPCPLPSSVSAVDESLSAKKKIKMSEEVPSKRVILILPNGSSPIPIQNGLNEEDITTFNNDSETNSENHITKPKVNEAMINLSTKLSGRNGFDHKTKSTTLKSNMETNTDEGFHETPVPAEILINNNVNEEENTNDNTTPSSKNSKISLGTPNSDANGQFRLTTSTPKLPRNSPPRRQIVRIKKMSKSKTCESSNEPSIEKLMQSTVESSSSFASKQSVGVPVGTLLTKNNAAILSRPVLSPLNILRKTSNRNSDSGNSSFRKIKINGLTLRAIDPRILKDSTLKEKIEILTRSRLDGITSNMAKSVGAKEVSENGLMATAKSQKEVNRKEQNCENCKQLQSEVNMQRQIISNLECNLMKLRVETNRKSLLDSKSNEAVEEIDNLNQQLMRDLRKERNYNNKLRTEIVNRDKHIEELERELTHVSNIFGEIERKSESLKKLIHNSVQPLAIEEFSDLVSVDYSDIDSCQ